jgi:hypothetical protein
MYLSPFPPQGGQPFSGGELTAWQQITQMDHVSEQYVYYLIDEAEKYGIFLTPEDLEVPK